MVQFRMYQWMVIGCSQYERPFLPRRLSYGLVLRRFSVRLLSANVHSRLRQGDGRLFTSPERQIFGLDALREQNSLGE